MRRRRRGRRYRPMYLAVGYLIAGALAWWYIARQMKQAATLTPEQLAYQRDLSETQL